MNKIINYFTNVIKRVAFLSANSLSMIGMYEPECPKELKVK